MLVNKIHGLIVFEETLSKCVLWSFEDAFFHSRSPENSRPIQAAQTFHSSQVNIPWQIPGLLDQLVHRYWKSMINELLRLDLNVVGVYMSRKSTRSQETSTVHYLASKG